MKYVLIFFVFCIFGCTEIQSSNLNERVKPAESEFIKTIGGGFAFVSGGKIGGPQEADIYYSIKYELKIQFQIPVIIKVEFENPIDNEKNLVIEREIPQGVTRFLANSPILEGIENSRSYKVMLTLYKDGDLLEKHIDFIRFQVREEDIEKLGIKLIRKSHNK